MRKRYVLAGLVMLLASAVSYELVQTASTPPAPDVIEVASPERSAPTPTAPLVIPTPAAGLVGLTDTLGSYADAALLLAAGATLLAAAAGVRRHTE